MTNETNCTRHFEEWCALDPKLPVTKDGDGEYENELTFEIWKCAEFMYKKGVWDGAAEMQKQCAVDYDKQAAHEAAKSEGQPVEITDDVLEAVINEHDMNVPDNLLASPSGFGAHREAMRAALQKIIPLTLHIEAEYKRAMKRDSSIDQMVEGHPVMGPAWKQRKESERESGTQDE